jgi:hypothetical protein
MRPYRCHVCDRRFFGATQSKADSSVESPQADSDISETAGAEIPEISGGSNPHEVVDTRG